MQQTIWHGTCVWFAAAVFIVSGLLLQGCVSWEQNAERQFGFHDDSNLVLVVQANRSCLHIIAMTLLLPVEQLPPHDVKVEDVGQTQGNTRERIWTIVFSLSKKRSSIHSVFLHPKAGPPWEQGVAFSVLKDADATAIDVKSLAWTIMSTRSSEVPNDAEDMPKETGKCHIAAIMKKLMLNADHVIDDRNKKEHNIFRRDIDGSAGVGNTTVQLQSTTVEHTSVSVSNTAASVVGSTAAASTVGSNAESATSVAASNTISQASSTVGGDSLTTNTDSAKSGSVSGTSIPVASPGASRSNVLTSIAASSLLPSAAASLSRESSHYSIQMGASTVAYSQSVMESTAAGAHSAVISSDSSVASHSPVSTSHIDGVPSSFVHSGASSGLTSIDHQTTTPSTPSAISPMVSSLTMPLSTGLALNTTVTPSQPSSPTTSVEQTGTSAVGLGMVSSPYVSIAKSATIASTDWQSKDMLSTSMAKSVIITNTEIILTASGLIAEQTMTVAITKSIEPSSRIYTTISAAIDTTTVDVSKPPETSSPIHVMTSASIDVTSATTADIMASIQPSPSIHVTTSASINVTAATTVDIRVSIQPSSSIRATASASVNGTAAPAKKKNIELIMYVTIGSVVGFIILIIIIIMAVGCRKGTSNQASFNVTNKTEYELGNFHSLPRACVNMYGNSTDGDGRNSQAYQDPSPIDKDDYAQGLPEWHTQNPTSQAMPTSDSFAVLKSESGTIYNAYDNDALAKE